VYCRGFSITRLEGSRWCLRRTRSVMEKVRECGLKLSRDERHLVTGDSQREGMLNRFVLRKWGHKDAARLKVRAGCWDRHTSGPACGCTSGSRERQNRYRTKGVNRRVGANPTPGSDTGMPTIADCRIRKHDGFSRSKSRKRSRFRFKAPPVTWYLSKTEFHRPAGFPIYDFAVTRQLERNLNFPECDF
jgi:hypothetical protein